MTPWVCEPAIGLVDGVNDTFTTPQAYATGSLRVGVPLLQFQGAPEAGWTELGSNRFKLNTPPKPGDLVFAYYRPV